MDKAKRTTKIASIATLLLVTAAAATCKNAAESQRPAPLDDTAPAKHAEPKTSAAGLQLSSAAFRRLGEIPKKYTCEGADISPPLSFQGLPSGTKSLALIIDDPDAPDPGAPKMTWVHWVLFNIPPGTPGLAEGAAGLPTGAREGRNDFQRTNYGGPCPPLGRHRYFHKLFALDTILELDRPTKAELETAMQSHILARAELVGTYQKSGN
jgi:Raf kinase inhibitor-like YbhB/YbcL family protein